MFGISPSFFPRTPKFTFLSHNSLSISLPLLLCDEFSYNLCSKQILFKSSKNDFYRIEISGIPYELITYFDPHYPLIVGGLQPMEESLGFIQVYLFFMCTAFQNSNLTFFVFLLKFQRCD
jgi:ribosome biogenesis protein BMS1